MSDKSNLKHSLEYMTMQLYNSKYREEYLEPLLKELAELERLAEIGRVTEKAFEIKGFVIIETEDFDDCKKIENVEKLLDWAKED